MSGLPRRRLFFRNRKPQRHKALRNATSGFVSRPRMRDMQRLRWAAVITSAM